jgi:hypothetical protein
VPIYDVLGNSPPIDVKALLTACSCSFLLCSSCTSHALGVDDAVGVATSQKLILLLLIAKACTDAPNERLNKLSQKFN